MAGFSVGEPVTDVIPMSFDASDPVSASRSMQATIDRCLNGDEEAWDLIVRQHRRRVFNIAYKFAGRHDEAEDLTQEIFLKVSKSLGTYDRRANFESWLGSVTRNLCIDYYRRIRKERDAVDREVDPDTLTSIPGQ